MRYRISSLLLVTAVVAVVIFCFTLGIGEGIFALLFFAPLASRNESKYRWASSLILVALLVAFGTYSRYLLRADLSQVGVNNEAFVYLYFAGSDQKRISEVYQFLISQPIWNDPGGSPWEYQIAAYPFFRTGYIKRQSSGEELPNLESRLRKDVKAEFPTLTVLIGSGHN